VEREQNASENSGIDTRTAGAEMDLPPEQDDSMAAVSSRGYVMGEQERHGLREALPEFLFQHGGRSATHANRLH
jgi:hypothetical protein